MTDFSIVGHPQATAQQDFALSRYLCRIETHPEPRNPAQLQALLEWMAGSYALTGQLHGVYQSRTMLAELFEWYDYATNVGMHVARSHVLRLFPQRSMATASNAWDQCTADNALTQLLSNEALRRQAMPGSLAEKKFADLADKFKQDLIKNATFL